MEITVNILCTEVVWCLQKSGIILENKQNRCYINSENTAISFNRIYFIYKFKLIFYPRVINSIIHDLTMGGIQDIVRYFDV